MDIKEILTHCDHTVLSQSATFEDIKAACDDGIKYHTATVCIPSCYVRDAKAYVGGKVRICTVVGFPHGYNTTASKLFEAEDAIREGADEIDTVVNVGWLKAGRDADVTAELAALKKVCGDHILKVIIETCLLTEDEKIRMCRIVTEAGVDYIKTSTGFAGAGATREDVKLMRENVGPNVKVKAAGGISTLKDAEDFLTLGAERLGTSRLVKVAKEMGL